MVRPVVQHGLLNQPTGQVIDGSLRFNGLSGFESDRLLRTPTSAGDRRKFTISTWIKFSKLNEGKWFGASNQALQIQSNGRFGAYFGQSSGLQSTRLMRDPNAFYHCVCVVDTEQSDESSRIRMYINGEYLHEMSNTSYPSEDANTAVNNSSTEHYIGISHDSTPDQESGGYMSQYYLLDGMTLGPGYFGFTDPATGAWKPKLLKQGDPTVNDGTTWSSGLSNQTGAANCFDGDLSTTYGPDGNTQTWTSPKPIQVHSQLRIFYSSGVASRQFTVNDNGNVINTGTGTKWVDLQFTGILTKIVGTNGWNCRAIEVDGVVLTDDTTTTVDFGTNGFYLPFDGKTPIGEDQCGKGSDWESEGFAGANLPQFANGALPILNTDASGKCASVGMRTDAYAVSPNDGTTWSTNSVSTTGGTLSDAGNGFDGSLDSSGYAELTATNSSTTANVTFNASIPDVTKVEVFVHSASSSGDTRGTCEDSNGTTYTSATLTSASQAFHTIYEGPPITLAKVGWGINQNGQTGTSSDGFRAFRVNGYVLKDSTSDEGLNLAAPLYENVINDVSHIVNSRSTQKTLTNTDTVASNAQSNFYGLSRRWDANSDQIAVAQSGNDLVLGTGDFTVECWVFDDNSHDGSNNRCYIWDNRVGGNVVSGPIMLAYVDDHQEWNLNIGSDSLIWDMSPDYSTERNRWFHVAATRRAGTVTMWINGIARATTTGNTENFTSNGIGIGYADTSGYGWAGYIQDFRIYKGVAKYTKNFIPAMANDVDIMPESPSGVTGTSELVPSGGSVSFAGGDDDYLLIRPGSDFAFGTGDFTIECFVFSDSRGSYDYIIDGRNSGQTTGTWTLGYGYSGSSPFTLDFATGSTTLLSCPESHNPNENKWSHVAVTRTGTALRMFVDGIQVTDATNSTDFSTAPSTSFIGTRHSTEHAWDGHISNIHVVKGTSLYTTNFTPPTGKIKPVANTVLLCLQDDVTANRGTVLPTATGTATAMWPLNSDINDDSGNSNNLTENGGSTSFTSAATNPFGITNAANFAKDGKYLSYAVDPASQWTIDGYVRLETTTTSAPYILGWNGTDGSDTCFGYPSDGSRKFGIFGSTNLISEVTAEVGRWYHIRITTNSTSNLCLYIDGELVARSTSTDAGPASPITIGDVQSGRFSGQIAGVRYTPADLGAPPKGGEITTNGVTTNSPAIGIQMFGDVKSSLFTPMAIDKDTCLGKASGYCTLNAIQTDCDHSTFTHGNLRVIAANASTAGGSIAVESGKWYCEMVCTAKSATNAMIGVCTVDGFDGERQPDESQQGGSGYTYVMNGNINPGGGSFGESWAIDDIMGIALDLDDSSGIFRNSVTYFKNGVRQGTVSIDAGKYVFACGNGQASSSVTYEVNFGQKPFKFPPPDGYQILNTANTRPQTVITRPDQHVGIVTYVGNDATSHSIMGLNFGTNPDFVWIKNRDQTEKNILHDTVRGVGNTLYTTSTQGSDTGSTYSNRYKSFDINGFTVGTTHSGTNSDGDNFVAWCWKAGGAPTADNDNTSGAMDANSVSLDGFLQGAYTPSGSPSTYPKRMSIGTTQGFSIVQYVGNATNRTLPHGLGKAPKFMIIKNMDTNSTGWAVYHDAIGHNSGDNYIEINDGQADSDDTAFQNTAPTTDLFSIGTKSAVNNDTDNTIAYIWADVPGLQKFGSYTGNANTDGVFVELGFRPAIVMLKNTGSSINWYVYDSARDRYNVGGKRLFLNTEANESTDEIDFVSNGFKWRDSGGANSSSGTWLYAAWAAAPSANLYGAIGEAR